MLQKILLGALLTTLLFAPPALAAGGCDLNDPDNDVPRLFPGSTSYKTLYLSIQSRGGEPLLRRIESRLGGARYISLYAPVDVPYTLYEIYNGNKKVGYIHGVNQKGQFGGIQVFLTQDPAGKIKNFYIQKMTGPAAGKLRNPTFARKLIGLSIQDFETYDPVTGKGVGKVTEIRNPSPGLETDFYGVLRGVKKNLVLMDEFVFSGKGARS